jgi:hypothetical protein
MLWRASSRCRHLSQGQMHNMAGAVHVQPPTPEASDRAGEDQGAVTGWLGGWRGARHPGIEAQRTNRERPGMFDFRPV